MAYQKKYYFSFKDLSERTHLVELWQNTGDAIVAEEVKGMPSPFVIEMPELDHKFQVVRGSGCTINLLSETDMFFFDGLYHVDPQEFMVKHYIDTVINWFGYLNAEMVTETYDIDFNYAFSITGNDGFSLMDRLSFVSSDDQTNFQGIASKYGILQIIFINLGLPFTEYRIALSTTFTGYSGDVSSTILHESFIDCSNFYDEDNKPMSYREVLESILAPYGAFIRVEGGIIYITDIHTLASESSIAYKRFNFETDIYSGIIAIPNIKSVSDIGYKGTGQSIELSGGINRQVVAYSPYPIKSAIDETIKKLSEFETIPDIFDVKNSYYYRTLYNNSTWEIDSFYDFVLNPPTFEQSYYVDPDEYNIYIRFPNYGGIPHAILNLKETIYYNIATIPDVNDFDDYYRIVKFWISGECLVKVNDNPYMDNDVDEATLDLYFTLKVGNDYYSQESGWSTDLYFNKLRVCASENFNEFNSFIFGAVISKSIRGTLEISFYSNFDVYVYSQSQVQEIWLKNLKVNILRNISGDEVPDNDIEYIGLLDKTFQNEGEKITLTCGTDSYLCDRGKILQSDGVDYSDITQWTRNTQTFKIEELLLGSVSSNYRAGFVTLSGMKLKNSFNLQNILTDTFIGSAKMMIKSANIDYHNDIIECDLVEILPDELTIEPDTTVA